MESATLQTDMLSYEMDLLRQGFSNIAGIDEAGRGPLAGPVVAAICILPTHLYSTAFIDSKQLDAEERWELYQKLLDGGASFGIGKASHEEIDKLNILQATFLSMKRALINMKKQKPDYLLIDGNRSPKFRTPKKTIIQGDAKSLSIAAASIIAKVTRDQEMIKMGKLWPEYGFESHKGYATERHLLALEKFGPCAIHRKTFSPMSDKQGK